MKNKACFILFILLSCPLTINAQQGFKEGYIIKNDSDTTHGFVKYSLDKNKGLSVEYKSDLTEESQTISVADLFGFGRGPFEHYQRLDLTGVDGIATLYFSRILVLGERMSLYKIPQGHLVVKQGSFPTYLTNGKKATNEADTRRQNTKALGAFITDCSEPLFEKANGSFNERSLIAISIAYNECLNSAYKVLHYDTTQPQISFEPFASLGLLLSTPNLEGAFLSQVAEANYKSTKSFTVGLGTIIRSPRFSTSTGFVLGAEYRQLNYYGYAREGTNLGDNNADVFVDTGSIRAILGLDFTKTLKDNWLSLQFGLSFNHFLSPETRVVIDDIRSGPNGTMEVVRSQSSPQLINPGSYAGIWVNLGFKRYISPGLKLGTVLTFERLSSNESFYADFNNFQLSIILSR